MGQYHMVFNLDRKEYLCPHNFGEGIKLGEFGCGENGTMTALAFLLAESNGQGGGDFEDHPLAGSWARDRIVISGDYAEDETKGTKFYRKVPSETGRGNLYHLVDLPDSGWREISLDVIKALAEDYWVCRHYAKLENQGFGSAFREEIAPQLAKTSRQFRTLRAAERRRMNKLKKIDPEGKRSKLKYELERALVNLDDPREKTLLCMTKVAEALQEAGLALTVTPPPVQRARNPLTETGRILKA